MLCLLFLRSARTCRRTQSWQSSRRRACRAAWPAVSGRTAQGCRARNASWCWAVPSAELLPSPHLGDSGPLRNGRKDAHGIRTGPQVQDKNTCYCFNHLTVICGRNTTWQLLLKAHNWRPYAEIKECWMWSARKHPALHSCLAASSADLGVHYLTAWYKSCSCVPVKTSPHTEHL